MNNWQTIPLGKIGTLERGKGLQKDDFTETGVPCIHYGQIFTYYKGFTDKTISHVSSETAKDCTVVHKGDTILAITSENVQDLCKNTVWLGDCDIVTGGHSGIFRHNQNPKFLGYYFQSDYFNHQKFKLAKGTKVIEINPDDVLKRIKIKLPDLETQQKIVQILDAYTNAIELQDSVIIKNEKLFKEYRSKLLLAYPGEEVLLGEVTSMHSGGTPNSKNNDYYGGTIPWVSIADMTSIKDYYIYDTAKHLSEEGFNSSSSIKIHPKGSILYAMYASIGECVIAGDDMASSQAILGIECSNKIHNKFLYYYLTNEKQKVKTLGQQGTQSNLNAKIVKNIQLSLPSIELQKEIVHKLDTQTEIINQYKQKKSLYIKQYKYLLNHLINGDFDLSNIKLENGKEYK